MQHENDASTTMTDEQILGLDAATTQDGVGAKALNTPATDAFANRTDANASGPAADGAAAPRATGEGSDHADGEPAWLAALASQPEAAAEARQWQAAAKDAARLDAAYFSADAGARTTLATQLFDTDPAAFRAMVTAGVQMMSERDPQGLAELARQLGAPVSEAAPAVRSVAQAVRGDAATKAAANSQAPTESQRQVGLSSGNTGAAFPADAYRAFQSGANDEVGRRVHDAIGSTLRTTLPEGIADGARRRIGEDIFEEVHASLAGDRDLARQVGEVLRDWRFDNTAQQQVTALLAGRARAVLPEIARRVISEWTSSVLASDRAKLARIDAAASRRDITGGRMPETVPAGALRGRVDYGRMSDEQIMEL